MNNKVRTQLDRIRAQEGEFFRIDEEAFHAQLQADADEDRSLVIKVLSVLGGIIGTLTFFGLTMMAWFEEPLLLGVVSLVAALVLSSKVKTILLDTVLVASYVAGVILIAVGLGKYNFTEIHILQLVFLIGLVTLVLSENFMLVILSILMMNASLVYYTYELDFPMGYHFIVAVNVVLLCRFMLSENRIITAGRFFNVRYDAIRAGLVYSLLIGLLVFPNFRMLYKGESTLWVSSIIISAAILYTVYQLIHRYKIHVQTNQVLVYLLALIFLVPAIVAPYLSGALLILLLSFYTQYQSGIGLGVVALLVAIIYYYYDLDLTLLTKSGILVGSGILLLALYYGVHRKMVYDEKI